MPFDVKYKITNLKLLAYSTEIVGYRIFSIKNVQPLLPRLHIHNFKTVLGN